MSQINQNQNENKKKLQEKQGYLEKKEEEVVQLRAKCKELEAQNSKYQEIK